MTMRFEVVTPKGAKVSAEAAAVSAPGTLGELDVLPGHRPLITSLGIGLLSYASGSERHYLVVNGGFLEVADDKLVVITERAETPDEIDIERAEKSLKEAEERLKELGDEAGSALEFALDSKKRALARIEAAKLKKQAIPE